MRGSRRTRVAATGGVAAAALLVVVAAPSTSSAVDTDVAISTTAIDFGTVNVGATASVAVTLTNTGGDPFGPINMFGGAPPTDEFNASQNCQGTTLPAGGSCQVSYSFSPGSAGPFSDSSNFTVSETASQSDGEDFSVSLTGVGFDPGATTTTSTATTTTTTTVAATTTAAPTTTRPGATTATSPSPATSTSTSTTAPTIWPLTGTGVVSRPALAVVVANTDAAPPSGLNDADVVFEAIDAGGGTRFVAVFNSTMPNPVGPVGAARDADIELLGALGDPALAYAAATDEVDTALRASQLELLTDGDPGFLRDPDREAPNDLVVNTSTLFAQLASSGPASAIFPYAAPDADPGGTPVTFVDLRLGATDVGWTWDARQGRFLRSQLGAAHELTDGPASADNVVVLVVADDDGTPDTAPPPHTVGTGPAFVYTAGRRLEGSWTRDAVTDPFTLSGASGPILPTPGRTWVELIDAREQLTDG